MELCKRLNFDHNNKWHINKPESFLWDFGGYRLITESCSEVLNLKRKHVKRKEKEIMF